MGVQSAGPEGLATVSILPQFFGAEDHPDALNEIRAWLADLHQSLERQDARIRSGDLTELQIPVTIASGADDQYLNAELSRHLANLFPTARMQLIENAVHWPQWQQPELVAERLMTTHV
jgi:pimeloyl-ACP methyl ester carboxylesterase